MAWFKPLLSLIILICTIMLLFPTASYSAHPRLVLSFAAIAGISWLCLHFIEREAQRMEREAAWIRRERRRRIEAGEPWRVVGEEERIIEEKEKEEQEKEAKKEPGGEECMDGGGEE